MSYLIRLYSKDKKEKPYFWGTHGAWTFLPESFKYMNYIHAKFLIFTMRLANKDLKISSVSQRKMEIVLMGYRNPISSERNKSEKGKVKV